MVSPSTYFLLHLLSLAFIPGTLLPGVPGGPLLVHALCSADSCELYKCERKRTTQNPDGTVTEEENVVSTYNSALNISPDEEGLRCIEHNADRLEGDGSCRLRVVFIV